jgi:hypothetical protein
MQFTTGVKAFDSQKCQNNSEGQRYEGVVYILYLLRDLWAAVRSNKGADEDQADIGAARNREAT